MGGFGDLGEEGGFEEGQKKVNLGRKWVDMEDEGKSSCGILTLKNKDSYDWLWTPSPPSCRKAKVPYDPLWSPSPPVTVSVRQGISVFGLSFTEVGKASG